MNNDLLQELEKHYTAFLKQKELDGDAHQAGIISYLRFIEETPIFRNIAHSIFSSPSSPSVIRNDVNDFYQISILHKPNSKPGHPIWLVSTGTGVALFHRYLVEGAKQFGLTNKRKIILHKEKNDNRVCLVGDTLLCYPIKREAPERFEIILVLFGTEAGKSAREIASSLWKKDDGKIIQDNIKKEIEKINILFKSYCDVSDDLIVHDKMKSKNIYFLNRKQFAFEVEK